MEPPPDFQKLGSAFADLKANGLSLQRQGLELVKIADAGAANINNYTTLYKISAPLAEKDPLFRQKLSLFTQSGNLALNELSRTNNTLRTASFALTNSQSGALAAVTISNVTAQNLVEYALETAPQESRQNFIELAEKQFSTPFSAEDLDELLARFQPGLEKRRAGAWDTFHSDSADALAQASHTMRDILSKVIAKVATNAAIENCDWYLIRKSKDPNTKPKISDRIRYLLSLPSLSNIDEEELAMTSELVSEYVDDDGALKATAHGSGGYTGEQISVSMKKIEQLLFLVFTALERAGKGHDTPDDASRC